MRYLFEDVALDTDRREIRRGGRSLSVEPLVFDLITHLIRNRQRVVSKEDLRAAIWGGRTVSESTLSSCITAVRATVGDNGEDQHVVRTLPRKGFRFVASVREEAEPAAPEAFAHGPTPVVTSQRSRTPARAAVVLAAAAGLGTIAATLLVLLWPESGASRRTSPLRAIQKFDAVTVPLVSDEMRGSLGRLSPPARRQGIGPG